MWNPRALLPALLLTAVALIAAPSSGVSNSGEVCDQYTSLTTHEVCAKGFGSALDHPDTHCNPLPPSGWDCVHFSTTVSGTADLSTLDLEWVDDHLMGSCSGSFSITSFCSDGPVDVHRVHDDFNDVCNTIQVLSEAPFWGEDATVTVKVGNGC